MGFVIKLKLSAYFNLQKVKFCIRCFCVVFAGITLLSIPEAWKFFLGRTGKSSNYFCGNEHLSFALHFYFAKGISFHCDDYWAPEMGGWPVRVMGVDGYICKYYKNFSPRHLSFCNTFFAYFSNNVPLWFVSCNWGDILC